ncbi:MAG: ABC transporter substrate-binding protein, partial [Xenococcaceae cyanobacterium]
MLATVILTASCNTQRTIQLTSKQPEPLQGEILMWVDAQLKVKEAQSSRSEKVFNDAIEEFRKLYPQVQVFTKIFPSGEIWESFELQVKRGSGPDLLLVKASTEISGLIQTGALKVIDESQIDQSRFRSEALKQVYYQGKLYGLPMYLSTKVLCYNKDKVKELPRTLPELIEQARKGYPVGVYSGFVETLWGTGVFGGRLFDPRGRVILAEGGVWAKGWAKWMKWLKQAQNEPNFILSDNAEALQQAFVEGKLTYLICPSDWIIYFSEALGKD